MNREEVLRKLSLITPTDILETGDLYLGGVKLAIELVEQIEPEYAVLNPVQAEQFESHNSDGESLADILNSFGEENAGLIARAWLDGFIIQEEALYRIKDPNTQQYLARYEEEDGVPRSRFGWFIQSERKPVEFTEAEIKEINPSYWELAERVENNENY